MKLPLLTALNAFAAISYARPSATDCAAAPDVPVIDASSAGDFSSSSSGSAGSDAGASLPVVLPSVACAELASVDLTAFGGVNSTVSSAAETTSGGVSYCAVNGKLNSSIGFTVLLPTATWTQRLLFSGCGGLCGMNSISRGSPDASGQFVVVGNDMAGGNDGTFGLDRDRRLNFAYRANHWATQAAKTLTKAYYARAPAFSYFSGCSDGGREAVMEALRFPDDFDGIVAGAPAFLFQLQNTLHHGWLARSNTAEDGTHPLVGSDRLAVLHRAVVAACDALDGLEDGLLSDPRLCAFDPASIQCAASETNTSACLTASEVDAVTKIYAGPVDAASGQHLTVGEAQFGSELSWQGVFVPVKASDSIMSEQTALAVLKYLAFEQSPPTSYSLADLEFSTATLDKLRARHPLFDAVSADLSAFARRGGKLILYHGWADPHISPRGTIAFHEALETHMGGAAVAQFERLYLLPGVYHCGGGEGFTSYDFLAPMQKWVEGGEAPDAVVVSSSTATRPLYPYPFLPAYDGVGDENAAASYSKGAAKYTNTTAPWAGADWFTPYTPIEG